MAGRSGAAVAGSPWELDSGVAASDAACDSVARGAGDTDCSAAAARPDLAARCGTWLPGSVNIFAVAGSAAVVAAAGAGATTAAAEGERSRRQSTWTS